MRYFIILFMVLALMACSAKQEQNNTVAKPQHLLNEDRFVEVTVDVRIAEASIRHFAAYGEDTKKLALYYYGKVWKKWGINEEIYRQNLVYYSHDPERLHELYGKVVAILTTMKNENNLRR